MWKTFVKRLHKIILRLFCLWKTLWKKLWKRHLRLWKTFSTESFPRFPQGKFSSACGNVEKNCLITEIVQLNTGLNIFYLWKSFSSDFT
jgi:hypothetical protein